MRNSFFSPSRTFQTPSPSPSPHRRNLSSSLMDENLDIAHNLITSLEFQTSLLFSDPNSRSDAHEFLRSIRGLQSAMHFFVKEGSSSDKLIRAQALMEVAAKRLEREFYKILSKKNRDLDPETLSVSSLSSRSSSSSDDVSDEEQENEKDNSVTADLKSIAETMIYIGYGKECVKIYKLIRKSVVDESLYNLGLIERLSLSQVQKMEWEAIDSKIRVWLKAVKIAVNNIFHGEKILCDRVFASSSTIAESCFADIANESSLNLFRFPEFVAKCKKLSPEKMFRVLDIYRVLSELLPDIEFIFSSSATSGAKSQAITSMLKLGEAVRAMLTEFEAAIQKEASKTSLPGGGVHPLTRYVMNYIVFLADYDSEVTEIIEDYPLVVNSPLPETFFATNERESVALSIRLAWIILVLLCKLDAKAELYRDVSLSYLFLANNLNYVVTKVISSNLKYLIGDAWVNQHAVKVKQYSVNYERMGWSKVTSALDLTDGNVLDKFRRFNVSFEEACRKQDTWVVYGDDLRAEIKSSLEGKIVIVYRSFYEEYREVFRGVVGEREIVRFAPEDVERRVRELFNRPATGK